LSCFFFFSSRRRHTRSKRDWSSDVCSSDLDDARQCTRMVESASLLDSYPSRNKYLAESRLYEYFTYCFFISTTALPTPPPLLPCCLRRSRTLRDLTASF